MKHLEACLKRIILKASETMDLFLLKPSNVSVPIFLPDQLVVQKTLSPGMPSEP